MNKKSAEASIRKLCTLGMDSQILIPRVLELLHKVIPSSSNVFFWLNEQGEINGIFDENPQAYALLPVYTSEFVNNREKDVFSGWKDASRFRNSVDQDLIWRVDRETFMQSAFYNDFMRHLGYHWGLHRPVWGKGRCCGILQMHRNRSECRFNEQERGQLDTVAAFIEHAFSRPSQPVANKSSELFYSKPSETALLITDTEGRVQHLSDGAERLYSLVDGMGDQKVLSISDRLPAALMNVIDELNKLQLGNPGAAPTIQMSNQWGRFCIHGQILSGSAIQGTPVIFAIQIEYFLPLRLELFDKVKGVALSVRQNEVALKICSDLPYAEIAEGMNISIHSLITHKKEVFRKLSVSSRHELKEKILEL